MTDSLLVFPNPAPSAVRFTTYPVPAQVVVADYLRSRLGLGRGETSPAWLTALQLVDPAVEGYLYPELREADRLAVLRVLDALAEDRPSAPGRPMTRITGLLLNPRQERYLLALLRLSPVPGVRVPDGTLPGTVGWEPTELRRACEPGGGGNPASTWHSLGTRELIEITAGAATQSTAELDWLTHITLTTHGRLVAERLLASQAPIIAK